MAMVVLGADKLDEPVERSLTEQLNQSNNSNITRTGAAIAGLPLSVLGGLDTVLQSVGLADENSMRNSIAAVSENVADVYDKNKNLYRGIGDVATMFVGAGLASKAIRVGGSGITALKASGKAGGYAAQIVGTNYNRVEAMHRLYKQRAFFATANGNTAANGIAAQAKLRSATIGRSALNNTKEAIAGEVFVATFQNQSELFFPEGQSWTDVATMAVLGGGVGVGVGAVVTHARLAKAAAASGDNLTTSLAQASGNEGTDLVAGAFEIETARAGPTTNFIRNDEQARGAFAQRGVLGQQLIKSATERLIEKSPIQGVTTNASSTLNASDLRETMQEIATNQPRLAANIMSIETVGTSDKIQKTRDALVTKQKAELEELRTEFNSKPNSGEKDTLGFKIEKAEQDIKRLEKETYMVDVNRLGMTNINGAYTPTLINKNYKVNKFSSTANNPTANAFKAFDVDTKKRAVHGIFDNGQVVRGKNTVTNTRSFNVESIAEVYAAMPSALKSLQEKLVDPKAVFGKPTKINDKTPLETLDFYLEAVKNNGNNPANVAKAFELSDTLIDLQSVQKLALDKRWDRFVDAKKQGGLSGQDLTIMTNLRMADDYGTETPTYEWFEDLFATGGPKAMSSVPTYQQALRGYRSHFATAASPQTVQEVVASNPERMDELLNYNMIERLAQNRTSFSLTVRKPTDEIDSLTTRSYRDMAAIARQQRSERLRGEALSPERPSFLAKFATYFNESKELVEFTKRELPKTNQASISQPLLQEAGRLSPFTQNHHLRHTPAGAATSSLSDGMNRLARSVVREINQTILQPVQLIRQTKNVASRQLYLNYHSAIQAGWRLSDDVVGDTGMFKLATEGAEGEINKQIAKDMGIDLPEFLPDVLRDNKQPLVLDEMASNALIAMREVDRMIYNGNQTLLRATDRAPRPYINGHTIIPSRGTQEMAFITDEMGNVVDFTVGRTQEAAMASASKRVQASKNSGKLSVVGKSNIENYKILQDQAFSNHALDISDTFALTAGRGAEGGRTGIISDPRFVDEQINEIERLIHQQSNRFTAVEMMPEINQMQYMSQVANVAKGNKRGVQTHDDVYDMTISSLLNTNNRNEGGLYTRIDNIVETTLNGVLDKMATKFDESFVGRFFDQRKANAIAEAMHKEFGYHPVKQTMQTLLDNKSINQRQANDIGRIVNKLGGVTQFMALKMFETGHALLTTASVMTTVPHSMAIFRRIGDESDEAFQQRLGYISEFLPNGMVVPNEVKLTTSTINKWMKGNYNDVIKEATKLGYLDAPMGEFAGALGSSAPRNKVGEWTQKVADLSGALSQKSEDFARTISFLTAYEMFKGAGKQGHRISMTVANDMANRVIADYRPHNRADLFKGVTGQPLGMFQSFAINYFEKMFNAIENKNTRELAIRTATQAFVFGGSGVAGYDLFNETVFNNWDKSQNPESYIKQGTDKGLADVLLYGTLSNLPKLLLDDGIALHTRGEMQTPKILTSLNPATAISNTPAYNFATRAGGFIGQAIDGLIENGSMSFDAAQEGLIMANVNRPTRGWLELIQGYATNRNHDITNDDTREFTSMIARFAGLKPLREAEESKALAIDKQTDMIQREHNIRLGRALVAKFRDGGVSGAEANKFMLEYIDNGGTVRGARQWLKNSAKKAIVSKFDRQLLRKMKQDPQGAETLRLLELDF